LKRIVQEQQEQIKKLIFSKDEKDDKKGKSKKVEAFDMTDPDLRHREERAKQVIETKKEEMMAEVSKLTAKKMKDN
jgi:hypothetical protein